MFSRIKRFYKEKAGINKIDAIQKELAILHRKSDEIYWSQVFNNTISNSHWLINKSFSAGRWAAGYPMLYLLYRIYNDVRPNSILEFGLGESTKLVYQYNKAFPQTQFTVIEQDEKWLDFFATHVSDIREQAIILEIEEGTVEKEKVNQYKNLLDNIGTVKYDMIVIDGPWGSPQYSRYQVIDILLNDLIAENFIIVMDDYNRSGEKQTIEKLKEVFDKKAMPYSEGVYSGIKDTYLICSKQYSFLTSL